MKEIYDINIQRMNNGAHFTFVSNILARAEADTAVKGKASELVCNFKAAVAAEDEALKISQKSLLTDDITKADSDRALVKMVNALALVFGEKDYTAFIDYVNTEITHYKREVIGQKVKAPTTSGGSSATTPDNGNKPSGGSSKPNGGGSSSSGDGDEIEG